VELFDLRGKVAIVTGGNGGIGLGMAQGLARAGADIAVVGRDQAKTERAVEMLRREFGVRSIGLAIDVTSERDVSQMVRSTLDQLGRINILVNNAGINIRKPPQDLSLDDWHKVIDSNLTSVLTCSKAVHATLSGAGGGKIINIGSMTSIFGVPFAPAYAASKGGVVQLTKSLAIAWASDNIQVNCILPGWIETALTDRARQEVPGLYERVLARTPQARWGKPSDLAGAAVFLASSASDFLTGVSLPVDGGYSIM
jgi:2-dehydro-3-deoxy-D-gluconate 5-dehydrogenase